MKLFLLLFLTINLFALTTDQEKVFKTVYNTAKMYHAKDGMTFEKTLTSIALRESSLGLTIVGAKNNKQTLKDTSLGVMQIHLPTAKFIIKSDPILKSHYSYLLKNNDLLVSALLHNDAFSTMIAAKYLIMNYEKAKSRQMWNPWYRAISRHNGGWNNMRYFKAVMKNMKFLEKKGMYDEVQ